MHSHTSIHLQPDDAYEIMRLDNGTLCVRVGGADGDVDLFFRSADQLADVLVGLQHDLDALTEREIGGGDAA